MVATTEPGRRAGHISIPDRVRHLPHFHSRDRRPAERDRSTPPSKFRDVPGTDIHKEMQ